MNVILKLNQILKKACKMDCKTNRSAKKLKEICCRKFLPLKVAMRAWTAI